MNLNTNVHMPNHLKILEPFQKDCSLLLFNVLQMGEHTERIQSLGASVSSWMHAKTDKYKIQQQLKMSISYSQKLIELSRISIRI